jgi:hypothetical protein
MYVTENPCSMFPQRWKNFSTNSQKKHVRFSKMFWKLPCFTVFCYLHTGTGSICP